MILFCDTSALVKLYIVEAGSEELKVQLQEAEAVCYEANACGASRGGS